MNCEELHLKLCLLNVFRCLKSAISKGMTDDVLHRQIVSGIDGWFVFRKFTKEEKTLISAIEKDKYFNELNKIDMSSIVYALELLRLCVEHYEFHISVSSKKLKKGKAFLAMGMLKKKKSNPNEYEELKEIIDTSVITAREFFSYTEKRIKEESCVEQV